MLSLTCEKAGCGKPLLTGCACRGRPGRDCCPCAATGMVGAEHAGRWRGR